MFFGSNMIFFFYLCVSIMKDTPPGTTWYLCFVSDKSLGSCQIFGAGGDQKCLSTLFLQHAFSTLALATLTSASVRDIGNS